MMLQSIAGLAAKAVNEKSGDEMVWVDNGKGDLEEWYSRFLSEHPNLEKRGTFAPWQLVDRYAERGIINGYPQDNTFRPNNNVTRGQLSKIVSESAGFTVCSHPIDYSDTFSSDVNDGSTVRIH